MSDKDAKDILYKLQEIQDELKTLKTRIESMHQDIRNLQGSISTLRF
jgi:prefoldin subunit 5